MQTLDYILIGFAALAIVVTLWSLAVALGPQTKPSVRAHAMDVFRIAWKTSVATGFLAIVRLYALGVFDAQASALVWWP